MQALYSLKDKLSSELEEYANQELTAGTLEMIDKLTHAMKNLDKVIDKCEEEESTNAYDDGMSNRSYARGMSNARGRGRGARRDSMGRYASENGYSGTDVMMSHLHELMDGSTDPRAKMEVQKLIRKLESM